MNTTIDILANAAAQPNNGINTIIMMVLMFIIFWVVLIRPQQKQRKELAARQAALKKGDKVITIGGIHGTVNAVSDRTVSIKVSDGIFVKFDKVAIATVNPDKKPKNEPVAARG